MKVAVGTSVNELQDDLSQYLVTEADGRVCYRIPLPIGSGVSTGETVATKRVPAEFDVETNLSVDSEMEENAEVNQGKLGWDYEPKGEHKGSYTIETIKYAYTFHYDEELLTFEPYGDRWTTTVGYKSTEDGYYYLKNLICELKIVKEPFEDFYQIQRNSFDSVSMDIEYPVEGVQEVVLSKMLIKYFPIVYTDTDGIEKTVYPFCAELDDGYSLQGVWELDRHKDKPLPELEAFLTELFYSVDILYK